MPRPDDFSPEKPKKKPRPPDEDVEEMPQARRRRPAEADEEPPPRPKRRPAEEDEEPPRPKRRRIEEFEDEPATKARRRPVQDDEEEPERPRRARRRRDEDDEDEDDGDAVSTIIPYKNPKALAAYYCGVFSIIPIGLILGPMAIVFGILGLRYVGRHPIAKGTGHAITGIILGFLTTIFYWFMLVWILSAGGPVGWYGKYWM